MAGPLSLAQSRAIAHVRARARAATPEAAARLASTTGDRARSAALTDAVVGALVAAPITLNFHPDRVRADGHMVVGAMLGEARYRNQFETRLTNGSPTAFAGGDRDNWEAQLFGRAYHDAPSARPDERPRYGGLNLMRHGDGACPRFGSCYLELTPAALARATFTWGDSHLGPAHVGVADALAPIAAALVEAVASTGEALGVRGLDLENLVAALDERRATPTGDAGRALDAYIEAQVHGEISLHPNDVAALVVDPSFDASTTGAELRELAARYGFAHRLHRGFTLDPRDVPDDFRGPRMPALAARVVAMTARDQLDAAAIGEAAASLAREPARWADWDAPAETWQHLKQLWHVLVCYGRPIGARGVREHRFG